MADERPEVATKATDDVAPTWRGALVRQLVDDAAARLNREIEELHRQRDELSRQLGELTMRGELLERITSLSDSMLERLVLELGATVPGARPPDKPAAPDRLYVDAEVAHWSARPTEEGGDVR